MEDTREPGAAPLVLVVDDDARNSRLLSRILEAEGYHTRSAPDGESALAQVAAERPDMMLVDVMMPGLDGYEVCRRIKADPETRAIPALLVTALNDPSDKVRGLDAGADDFLTKPINRGELLARVRTHFRIKRLRDEVVDSRESLARQNRKLLALERMREDLVHMLVHDLKSPLSAIQLNVDLLQTLGDGEACEVSGTVVDNIAQCVAKMSSMVGNILDVARLEGSEMSLRLQHFALSELAGALERHFQVFVRDDAKTLTVDVPDALPHVIADRDMVSRVLENLVSNAIKLTRRGGDIVVLAETGEGGETLVTVADRGPGVPENLREAIFDKFTTLETQRIGLMANHGLGLTFCKMAIAAHGGRIWVESRDHGGSLFRFTLPAMPVERGAVEEAGCLAEEVSA